MRIYSNFLMIRQNNHYEIDTQHFLLVVTHAKGSDRYVFNYFLFVLVRFVFFFNIRVSTTNKVISEIKQNFITNKYVNYKVCLLLFSNIFIDL